MSPVDESPRLVADAIGVVEVPGWALYGARTHRAVTHLSVSGRQLGSAPALVSALADVKATAAAANLHAGVVEVEVAAAIIDATDTLRELPATDPRQLPADLLGGGGWIGVHHNVNEVLATLASRSDRVVDPIGEVSASQSTADVCHTAARLAATRAGVHAVVALQQTSAALDALSERLGGIPSLGRACLMDATVVDAGSLWAGSAAAVARSRSRLVGALEPLRAVTLGSAVLGDDVNRSERYQARVVPELSFRSGLPLTPHTDAPSVMQHGDDLVWLSAAVAGAAAVLSRAARDLRLLGAGPVGGPAELRHPPALEGFARFHDEHNPAIAESIIAACTIIEGCHHTVQATAMAAELHLNVFESPATVALLDSLGLLAGAADALGALATGVEPDRDRIRALADAVHFGHIDLMGRDG